MIHFGELADGLRDEVQWGPALGEHLRRLWVLADRRGDGARRQLRQLLPSLGAPRHGRAPLDLLRHDFEGDLD